MIATPTKGDRANFFAFVQRIPAYIGQKPGL
jgi:hypothetical protein